MLLTERVSLLVYPGEYMVIVNVCIGLRDKCLLIVTKQKVKVLFQRTGLRITGKT